MAEAGVSGNLGGVALLLLFEVVIWGGVLSALALLVTALARR